MTSDGYGEVSGALDELAAELSANLSELDASAEANATATVVAGEMVLLYGRAAGSSAAAAALGRAGLAEDDIHIRLGASHDLRQRGVSPGPRRLNAARALRHARRRWRRRRWRGRPA